jgi:hypothetical protein
MLYLAHFSFDGEYKGEPTHGWFTCMVEADDIEASVDAFHHLISKLQKDEDIFQFVSKVYLEDIIQIRQVPEKGFLGHYSSSPGEARPSIATTCWGDTDSYCESFSPISSDNEEAQEIEPFIVFRDDKDHSH